MCWGETNRKIPHPRRHLHALIDEQLLVWMTTATESASKHSMTGGVAQVLLLGLLLGLQQDPLCLQNHGLSVKQQACAEGRWQQEGL